LTESKLWQHRRWQRQQRFGTKYQQSRNVHEQKRLSRLFTFSVYSTSLSTGCTRQMKTSIAYSRRTSHLFIHSLGYTQYTNRCIETYIHRHEQRFSLLFFSSNWIHQLLLWETGTIILPRGSQFTGSIWF